MITDKIGTEEEATAAAPAQLTWKNLNSHYNTGNASTVVLRPSHRMWRRHHITAHQLLRVSFFCIFSFCFPSQSIKRNIWTKLCSSLTMSVILFTSTIPFIIHVWEWAFCLSSPLSLNITFCWALSWGNYVSIWFSLR